MCGIAGFVLPQPILAHAEIEARLWAMLGTLRHRGPDDEGVWTDGLGALAHARLSIIDLSPAGHQPIADMGGDVWLTYNGEVYNFVELRAELEGAGYVFRSRTDSEVIANGWHAWGPLLFGRLRGMFALALWDRRSRRLILARDRIGKKPLYYAQRPEVFLFGSEIKALLAWPGLPRTPNLAAIDHYLTLQYVPAPETAFAGVKRLPPAHYLVVGADSAGNWQEAEPVRYWELPEPDIARVASRPAELQRELVAHLTEAVRLRMIADVPLGAFLSGGVDSSAVVAMMARAGTGRVKTFSIGFPEKGYDETRYARMVAERYGTEHEEFIVEPDAVAILPRIVWHYGEPFADPSAIPTWYVSEMARRRVTVALNGDGGDEAFLGYARYRAMRHLDRLDRLPAGGRIALARLCALAPTAIGRPLRLSQIRDMLDAPIERPEQRYAGAIAFFGDRDKRAGYGEAMRAQLAHSALDLLAPYFASSTSLLAGANRADLHTYLPDDLMVKVDVASMAHGLETRSPLLDHVLLEWAARLPPEVKMAGGRTKALFKAAMAPYLPPAILHRRKMGFAAPIDRWLRRELKSLAYDTLLAPAARRRGLMQPDYVKRLLDEHCTGRANHHTRLWALLMLELWFRTWIDGAAASETYRPAA
ncbi:MAG TPA: asparagine synthase (glutamine-hydrolyzing) [Stellaceae bacterium]|jgi:asparagine synthase (glutamine-hydrolysing)|nr:asparagine synthase (glutamine-hydrolyzing) [Stellaceae bacterium]